MDKNGLPSAQAGCKRHKTYSEKKTLRSNFTVDYSYFVFLLKQQQQKCYQYINIFCSTITPLNDSQPEVVLWCDALLSINYIFGVVLFASDSIFDFNWRSHLCSSPLYFRRWFRAGECYSWRCDLVQLLGLWDVFITTEWFGVFCRRKCSQYENSEDSWKHLSIHDQLSSKW